MKKTILIIFAIIIFVSLAVFGIDIQSVEDYYSTHLDEIRPNSLTVFLSIDCSSVFDNWEKLDSGLRDEKYTGKDGVILPKTEYMLIENDTVFDILLRVTKYHKIPLDYDTSLLYSSVYIKGINHIYEFSCGSQSGWVFSVNNKPAQVGASAYKPKDGDEICFVYLCEYSTDFWGSAK